MTDSSQDRTLQANDIEFGFITKSDRNFYDGLIALLASLNTWHPGRPVTVVDCGLTSAQAKAVAKVPEVRLIGEKSGKFKIPSFMQHFFTPAIYGFFSVHDDLYPLTVHIDADAVVIDSLDEFIRAAYTSEVGISAVPDYPHLDLSYQLGTIDGAYPALCNVIHQPCLESISFNGGVFALRSNYYRDHMRPWVNQLIPYHELFWGNDMAIMNFAAYAANRDVPFNIVCHSFNTRASYRRAPDLQANRLVGSKFGCPALEGPFGMVKILHFVGMVKPWEEAMHVDDSVRAWRHYRDMGASRFE